MYTLLCSRRYGSKNFMCDSTIETLAAIFTAFGTVLVSVIAIWGDWIKAHIAGPRIALSLRDTHGDLNVTTDGKRTIYYHLNVRNRRSWSPARAVRVMVEGVSKRRPDGSYFPDPVVTPLQLTWAFPGFHEMFPTITVATETCDFGYVEEQSGRFQLSTYIAPNNFKRFIASGEAMRVIIVASAHNGQSESPFEVEVSWDGQWSTDLNEMQRHLVIKDVSQR